MDDRHQPEAANFPGSQGATVLRSRADRREFHTILQFDTPDHLQGWLESPERAICLERLSGIVIESEEVNSLTGMERWFTPPPPVYPPPPSQGRPRPHPAIGRRYCFCSNSIQLPI